MQAISLAEAQTAKADQLTQYRAEIDVMASEIVGELNNKIAEQPFVGDWRATRGADSTNNLIVKYAMQKAALAFGESGEFSPTVHAKYDGYAGDPRTRYTFEIAVMPKEGLKIPEVLAAPR